MFLQVCHNISESLSVLFESYIVLDAKLVTKLLEFVFPLFVISFAFEVKWNRALWLLHISCLDGLLIHLEVNSVESHGGYLPLTALLEQNTEKTRNTTLMCRATYPIK